MKKLFLSIFIMLMFFSVAKAEFVNNILVNGNERVSTETIILLGGIEKDNVVDVMRAGASGIAVIRSVLMSDDPECAASQLYTAMEQHIL